jgi:hypothetical protein
MYVLGLEWSTQMDSDTVFRITLGVEYSHPFGNIAINSSTTVKMLSSSHFCVPLDDYNALW